MACLLLNGYVASRHSLPSHSSGAAGQPGLETRRCPPLPQDLCPSASWEEEDTHSVMSRNESHRVWRWELLGLPDRTPRPQPFRPGEQAARK